VASVKLHSDLNLLLIVHHSEAYTVGHIRCTYLQCSF